MHPQFFLPVTLQNIPSMYFAYIRLPFYEVKHPFSDTLLALIAMSTGVFILKKKITQHALIVDHTLINFGEKNSAKIMKAAISNHYSLKFLKSTSFE